MLLDLEWLGERSHGDLREEVGRDIRRVRREVLQQLAAASAERIEEALECRASFAPAALPAGWGKGSSAAAGAAREEGVGLRAVAEAAARVYEMDGGAWTPLCRKASIRCLRHSCGEFCMDIVGNTEGAAPLLRAWIREGFRVDRHKEDPSSLLLSLPTIAIHDDGGDVLGRVLLARPRGERGAMEALRGALAAAVPVP